MQKSIEIKFCWTTFNVVEKSQSESKTFDAIDVGQYRTTPPIKT